MSNFALVDSDLNVDIEVGEPAKFLSDLLEVLRHDKTGVVSELHAMIKHLLYAYIHTYIMVI